MPLDSTGLSQLPVAHKHSLFPRTLFFDIKFSSNNILLFMIKKDVIRANGWLFHAKFKPKPKP